VLRGGRSRVLLPMVSLIFFNAPNPSSHTVAPGFNRRVAEINTERHQGPAQPACEAICA
jgi:hypothetical protein